MWKKLRKNYKRVLAFMLTVAMTFTNMAVNMTTIFAAAGEEEEALFVVDGLELARALREAKKNGKDFDYSSLDLKARTKKLKGQYEKMLKDGNVYQLDMEIDDSYAPDGTGMEVFYNEETDDVIFLFINGSDLVVNFRASIDGYETEPLTIGPNAANVELDGEEAADFIEDAATKLPEKEAPKAEVVGGTEAEDTDGKAEDVDQADEDKVGEADADESVADGADKTEDQADTEENGEAEDQAEKETEAEEVESEEETTEAENEVEADELEAEEETEAEDEAEVEESEVEDDAEAEEDVPEEVAAVTVSLHEVQLVAADGNREETLEEPETTEAEEETEADEQELEEEKDEDEETSAPAEEDEENESEKKKETEASETEKGTEAVDPKADDTTTSENKEEVTDSENQGNTSDSENENQGTTDPEKQGDVTAPENPEESDGTEEGKTGETGEGKTDETGESKTDGTGEIPAEGTGTGETVAPADGTAPAETETTAPEDETKEDKIVKDDDEQFLDDTETMGVLEGKAFTAVALWENTMNASAYRVSMEDLQAAFDTMDFDVPVEFQVGPEEMADAAQIHGDETAVAGELYTFAVETEEGYEVASVMANGEELEAIDPMEVEADGDTDWTEYENVYQIEVPEEELVIEVELEEALKGIPAATYTGESEDAVFTIEAPEGAFEEEVELKVTKIEDEEELAKISDQANAAVEGAVAGLLAYDVTFVSKETGEEVEPQAPVSVSVGLKTAVVDESVAKEDITGMSVVHVPDEGEAEEVAKIEAEEIVETAVTETTDPTEIKFEAESFSTYVITVNANAAATVDGEMYQSLQAAIDSIQGGSEEDNEITLLTDIQENVESTKNYTLNLNNHTWSCGVKYKTFIRINSGNVVIKNGTITGGKTVVVAERAGAISLTGDSNLTLENCRVIGNEGGYVGAIDVNTSDKKYGLTLKNTVITDNSTSSTSTGDSASVKNGVVSSSNTITSGGICVLKGYFRMEDSAVYGNKTKISTRAKNFVTKEQEPAKTYKDIDIVLYKSGYVDAEVPAASEMMDPEKPMNYFADSQYIWYRYYSKLSWYEPTDASFKANLAALYWWQAVPQITDMPTGGIAINTNSKVCYDALSNAISEANAGDTIKLQPQDGGGVITNGETKAVSINKTITLDLNGQKIKGGGLDNTLFDVTSKGDLTITDSSEAKGGQILNTASVSGTGKLTVKEGAIVGTEEYPILHNGGSLTYKGKHEELYVQLAQNKAITAGEGFNAQKIHVSFPKEIVDQFRDAEASMKEDIVIVKGFYGEDVVILDGVETGKVSIVKSDENNTVVQKTPATGIYWSGDGNDSKDGSSAATAVSGFDKVKELLENSRIEESGNPVKVYVTSQIDVDGSETWDLNGLNAEIVRDHSYKGALVNVKDGGILTLSNIVFDGQANLSTSPEATYKNVDDGEAAMITVAKGGKLVLEQGAKLQNNCNAKSKGNPMANGGGAINNYGTVEMNDGEISSNRSWLGGGVYNHGTFDLIGGSITGNLAEDKYSSNHSYESSGGGIFVSNTGTLNMKGGSINNNRATNGGGIGIGCEDNLNLSGGKLYMSGGKVDGNTAENTGGGIFVQAGVNKGGLAEITGGDITNNKALCTETDKSMYGGGGIYVNGYPDSDNGRAKLENVIIAHNTGGAGKAVAACPSSKNVKINLLNGGAIYSNDANGGKDFCDVRVDGGRMQDGHSGWPFVAVSSYMLGGGEYEWYDTNTKNKLEINEEGNVDLRESRKKIAISTPRTDTDPETKIAEELAKVRIENNTAELGGGGIGSNGEIQIGKDEPVIRLEKKVEGVNAVQQHKDDEFKLEITLKDASGNPWSGSELKMLRSRVSYGVNMGEPDVEVEEETLSFKLNTDENGTQRKTAELMIHVGEIIVLSSTSGGDSLAGVQYEIREIDTKGATHTEVEWTTGGNPRFEIAGDKEGEDPVAKGTVLDAGYVTGVTFTNTFDSVLSIKKVVNTLDAAEREKEWSFELNLTTSDNKPYEGPVRFRKAGNVSTLDLQYLFDSPNSSEAQDGMRREGGKITFTLKDGETCYFNDLPVGTKFRVSELQANQDGYETKFYLNGEQKESEVDGIISKDNDKNEAKPIEVECVNTQHIGGLSVKKTVYSPSTVEKARTWDFEVDLETADGQPYTGKIRFQKLGDPGSNTQNVQYLLDGQNGSTEQDGIKWEEGKLTFTLKDGETCYLNDLPVGTKFKVSELQADKGGYDTKFYLDGKELEESEAEGVISEDEDEAKLAEVECVNTQQVGNLTVSKTVTGSRGDTNKDFNFTVTLSDDTITGAYGDMNFTGGVATFALRNGQSRTATNLPAGTTYSVTETEANRDGYTTSSTGENGTIEADQTAEVAFTNNRGGGGGGNNSDGGNPPPSTTTTVNNPDVPLASLPNETPDLVDLEEAETPLAALLPKTGDSRHMAAWLMLFGAAGVGMLGAAIGLKKKHEDDADD